ncbi:MAG TPA: hypothetical protein DCR87_01610 [Acidobacteria bacterium]|nr:hypothetical protein [Acidobacteriota bacterium]
MPGAPVLLSIFIFQRQPVFKNNVSFFNTAAAGCQSEILLQLKPGNQVVGEAGKAIRPSTGRKPICLLEQALRRPSSRCPALIFQVKSAILIVHFHQISEKEITAFERKYL